MSDEQGMFGLVNRWIEYLLRETGTDGTGYLAMTDLAADTPWLQPIMLSSARFGLVVLGVIVVAGWWMARTRSDDVMAAALLTPGCLVVVYLICYAAQHSVRQPPPCRSLPAAVALQGCPAETVYSFPALPVAIAAAITVAAAFVNRRLALAAAVAAVLMAFAEVYDGGHYPNDVLAGLVLGGSITLVLIAVLAWLSTPMVRRLRGGPLQPVLGTGLPAHDARPT